MNHLLPRCSQRSTLLAPSLNLTRTFSVSTHLNNRNDSTEVGSLYHPNHETPNFNRLREHYYSTLQPDLLYLTYNHIDPSSPLPPPPVKPSVPGLSYRNKEFKKTVRPKIHSTSPIPKAPSARTNSNIPELKSIHLHTFIKDAINNKYTLLNALMQFEAITGKHPEIVKAQSNVALWKLREGMPIGVKVKLEGYEMYNFLDKLVELVLPRLKGWYGIPGLAGDGSGNISIGFESNVMSYFPEIEQVFDRYPFMCGFDLTFRTTAQSDWEARLLLSGFQIPIEDEASKRKREKYMEKEGVEIDPNEPEWMKFKREREAKAAAKGKK